MSGSGSSRNHCREARTRAEEPERVCTRAPPKRVGRAFALLTQTYHGSRLTGHLGTDPHFFAISTRSSVCSPSGRCPPSFSDPATVPSLPSDNDFGPVLYDEYLLWRHVFFFAQCPELLLIEVERFHISERIHQPHYLLARFHGFSIASEFFLSLEAVKHNLHFLETCRIGSLRFPQHDLLRAGVECDLPLVVHPVLVVQRATVVLVVQEPMLLPAVVNVQIKRFLR